MGGRCLCVSTGSFPLSAFGYKYESKSVSAHQSLCTSPLAEAEDVEMFADSLLSDSWGLHILKKNELMSQKKKNIFHPKINKIKHILGLLRVFCIVTFSWPLSLFYLASIFYVINFRFKQFYIKIIIYYVEQILLYLIICVMYYICIIYFCINILLIYYFIILLWYTCRM